MDVKAFEKNWDDINMTVIVVVVAYDLDIFGTMKMIIYNEFYYYGS